MRRELTSCGPGLTFFYHSCLERGGINAQHGGCAVASYNNGSIIRNEIISKQADCAVLICLVLHALHASFSFFFMAYVYLLTNLCWHFNQLCTVLQENALAHTVCSPVIRACKIKEKLCCDGCV